MFIEVLAAAAVLSGGGQQAAPYSPGGQERVAPRGDYRDTCSGAYVNRGRLYADCRDRRATVRGTSIELNRCTDYEIRNNDGLLSCGRRLGSQLDHRLSRRQFPRRQLPLRRRGRQPGQLRLQRRDQLLPAAR